ncbi:sigma-E processing peptidase SpoIIGA [Clostridium sp. KNHs214]|uniref:sigma-E processing peptidase SpoIIGA n=1 Tax=Clostridium sp. KNHs214 TaxID=1540257 RepID=UPI000557A2EA|nr:sigma-E processing peptidase SpoIIGA [Clostridium sp. KNHs214]
MIIYVDVVFIENFIINMFFLYITASTVKARINFRNIIISSFLGAFYVVILLYFKFNFLSLLPMKLLVAFAMIIIAYKSKSFKFYLKALAVFISYSMLLAGICLFSQLNNKEILNMGDVFLEGFSYKKLILCSMIIYIFINRMVVYIRDRKLLKTLVYNVEIVTDKYNKLIKAFLDTGNELREPVTNLPVIIVEKNQLPNIKQCKDKLYITYKAVNGQCGRMEAFKPAYINIYKEDFKEEKKQVIIALCDTKLSKDNDYNALLSRGIFE